jgi:hypothetical protein
MKSFRFLLVCICLLCLVSPSLAFGWRVPRLDPTQQTIQAEVIIVGRIVEIEDTDSVATGYEGAPEKTAYKIANIKINESLVGAKGITHIRVGFIPTNQPLPQQIKGLEEEWGYGTDSYGINDQGCFFLRKHHEGNFYVPLHDDRHLDSKQQNYDMELGKIKQTVHAFEKPLEALQAKSSAERQFAASALIHKYRTEPTSNQVVVKEVEIPKEESKSILDALSEIENDPNQITTFMNLFYLLRLTERDGWIQPKSNDPGENNRFIIASFGKWYKMHGEKYRMKKLVITKK